MRLTAYRGLLLVLGIVSIHGSNAQIPETIAKAPITVEEARTLRDRASAMKGKAEQQFRREMAECNKKLFPNSCFDATKERKHNLLTESHSLDQKAREGERVVHRLERDAKEAQRAADAPRMEAEEQARIEKLHQENARRDAERANKPVQDAIDLEQRRSKIQADEAAQHNKREAQARRDAEVDRLRPSRIRAEQERQRAIAEHAAKIDERIRQNAEEQKRREATEAAKHAAEETAKRNPDKKSGLLCELLPGRYCTEAGTGK